ncbi:hypothetical protein [Microbulbifer sp. 2205BS26-8]|uniref:hypothetical protein n=1 Tax=Microbulbifer sp. 2205BS26-8 TaxID=3064386 RepID=UPI00273F2C42|nr:hypothetical protein [Microbulbifer sp. 2205BS26-8]MDP5210541.1 hypothetical protein [Microbulbifer sp. 2205BS26-8]
MYFTDPHLTNTHSTAQGQGVLPRDHHIIADSLSQSQLQELMANLKTLINGSVNRLPDHAQFLPDERE